MTAPAPRPGNVFTIPAGVPFVDALAAGIRDRAGPDPQALVPYTVLLPTRRACRALREAFLRGGDGRPLLLPRLMPLGELDDEDLSLLGWEAEPAGGAALDPDIPPPLGGLRRQLLLARLILARAGAEETDMTPDQAARLAQELARLLDQVHTERLSLDGLADLVPGDFADHWRITLEFLSILSDAWPAILADEGCLDPAARRNRLLEARAAAWRARPPAGPVIAAGSTGSIPATADLLAVVAALPTGAVVLPGLDRDLDDDAWSALEPSHPQFGLARLLAHLGLDRAAVADWPAPGIQGTAADRARLVNTALRPAAATGEAARLDGDLAGGLDSALAGVARVDCPTAVEEAAVVALAVRETLQTPGRTVAVVTPDRALARRVTAELRRWGVEVDDSAGLPLHQTPPGAFLRLTARMVADGLAPVPLLAALKHPLAAGGQEPGAFRARVRDLERAVLRGLRPGPGVAGLRAAVRAAERGDLEPFLGGLERALQPFAAALSRRRAPLRELLRAHADAAEALAATTEETGAARLWAGEAGEAAADFVAELGDTGDLLAGVDGADYPALLETLLAARVVRPRYGRHPRVAILGLLEARLQHADRVILAGLNEGTWPPEAPASPWMSRPMMARFGLPLPERRVGLTAHDFVQGFCAPEVIVTRAERDEGTPTVPSRWLVRLDNLLGTAGARLESGPWLSWALGLDTPGAVTPVKPPEPRPPLEMRPTKLSVTRIETWIRDPYAVFARHVLGLEPLDPLDADVGAADRGIVVHKALERFVKELPGDLPADALDRLLAIGHEVFRAYRDRPAVQAFWWPRFERIAAWFVDYEHRRRAAGVRTLKTEARGELPIAGPAATFTLSGVADRIDRLPDGTLAILDYKTGAPPSGKQVEAGLAPQLSLEAAMAAQGGFTDVAAGEVAQLAYLRLSGGRQPGEEKVLKLDVDEVAAAALDGLTKRVATFQMPETPYRSRPVPMFEGRFGDYDHLARVKEWRAGPGGDES
ncbi:MAG: double-strand break repair protein AddB [Hyphomicrobiales bacterium]|nr:double-strand break repair protein AddB [Hyphomicrobiales bacterium]